MLHQGEGQICRHRGAGPRLLGVTIYSGCLICCLLSRPLLKVREGQSEGRKGRWTRHGSEGQEEVVYPREWCFCELHSYSRHTTVRIFSKIKTLNVVDVVRWSGHLSGTTCKHRDQNEMGHSFSLRRTTHTRHTTRNRTAVHGPFLQGLMDQWLPTNHRIGLVFQTLSFR